jgi:hypothetical protein
MPQTQRAARAAQTDLRLDYRRGQALTNQIQDIYANLDAAVVETLRLNANMIETARAEAVQRPKQMRRDDAGEP